MEQSVSDQDNFHISKWLTEGWTILFNDFGQFLGLTCIYLIVTIAVGSTAIGLFLVAGPLNIGFFYIITLRLHNRPFNINDISKGFNYYFSAVLADIVISFFVGFGFICCIIPGIVLYSIYLIAELFIFDRDMDFWEAMESSRKVMAKHIFEGSVLVIIMGIVFFIGFMFCGIGIIIAIPYLKIIQTLVYRDLVGFNKTYTETGEQL